MELSTAADMDTTVLMPSALSYACNLRRERPFGQVEETFDRVEVYETSHTVTIETWLGPPEGDGFWPGCKGTGNSSVSAGMLLSYSPSNAFPGSGAVMNPVHDMGGVPNDEPIDRSEQARTEWDQRTSALIDVLCEKRLINVDQLRRGIESLPSDEYRSLSYYERWAASVEIILVERGVLSAREIDVRAAAIAERWG